MKLCALYSVWSHLDKHDASEEFEEQHDSHGGGIDGGIVLHHGIVPHAVAHHGAVTPGYSGVLHTGKGEIG